MEAPVPATSSSRRKRRKGKGKGRAPPAAGAAAAATARPAAAFDATRVVLNAANIGHYSREPGAVASAFDWARVEAAVAYYLGRGVRPMVVVRTKKLRAVSPDVPAAVRPHLVPVPDRREHDNDDLFTMRIAHERNCQYVDNDRYRDWVRAKLPAPLAAWQKATCDALHVAFVLDVDGAFVPDKLPLSVAPAPASPGAAASSRAACAAMSMLRSLRRPWRLRESR